VFSLFDDKDEKLYGVLLY